MKAIEENTASPNLTTMISDCRLLLTTLKEYKLKHVFREANAVADQLAKHRLPEQGKFTLFYQPPSFSLHAFNNDLFGALFHRQISSSCFSSQKENPVLATTFPL